MATGIRGQVSSEALASTRSAASPSPKAAIGTQTRSSLKALKMGQGIR